MKNLFTLVSMLLEIMKNARITKKEIYAFFGIDFDGKKITVPVFGKVNPLLKNGNSKIGKGVWHFSILPTTKSFQFVVNGKTHFMCGTCCCDCKDCYACTGHYKQNNVKASLGINTFLARYNIGFLIRAIVAQIIADKIKICRVHVAGDFFSDSYVNMWKCIAKLFPTTCFWTYTKVEKYETAFDSISNFNAVKSVISGYGYNFGTCAYIIALYEYLKSQGKTVYICKCGFDDNQHCFDCGACRNCDYVLFLLHSTKDYDGKADKLYPVLKAIVLAQDEPEKRVA